MFVLLKAPGSVVEKISAFIKRKSRVCACRDKSENMNLRPGKKKEKKRQKIKSILKDITLKNMILKKVKHVNF